MIAFNNILNILTSYNIPEIAEADINKRQNNGIKH